MYDFVYAHTIGAGHKRSNLPYQDFGIVRDIDGYKVFAVSDGHGDPNCFRSDRGARFACEIAVDMLVGFMKGITEDGYLNDLFKPDEFEKKYKARLSRSIIWNWLIRIGENLKQDPITPEVIEEFENKTNKKIKYKNDYLRKIRLQRAYGCTLIAGIYSKDVLLLVHHGDGRCILVDGNGEVSQPVPWDQRCIGSSTTSCCDPDAVDSLRFSVLDLRGKDIIACFAASDGVEDSFADIDAVYSFFLQKILYATENGIEKLNAELAGSLPELSANGSADDITICGIMNIEKSSSFTDKFRAFSEHVECIVRLKKVEDKINSILNGGLYTHLKKEKEAAEKRYDETCKRYDFKQAERIRLQKNFNEIVNSHQLRIEDKQNMSSIGELIAKLLDGCGSYTGIRDELLRQFNSTHSEMEALAMEMHEAERLMQEAQRAFEKIDAEYRMYLQEKEMLERQIKNS